MTEWDILDRLCRDVEPGFDSGVWWIVKGAALYSQGEDFVRGDVCCHPYICVRVRCWIPLKILWLGL